VVRLSAMPLVCSSKCTSFTEPAASGGAVHPRPVHGSSCCVFCIGVRCGAHFQHGVVRCHAVAQAIARRRAGAIAAEGV
jgi:hypothetical protein